MRLSWVCMLTLSSLNQPQEQLWTNLLQKGGVPAAKIMFEAVRTFSIPCSTLFLAFRCLWLVRWWCRTGFFIFCQQRRAISPAMLPCSTGPAAARPPRPGVQALQDGLCLGKRRALSLLPTGGHCHHGVSGAVVLTGAQGTLLVQGWVGSF